VSSAHCKKNRRTSPSFWAWAQTNLSVWRKMFKYISVVGKFRRNRTSLTKKNPFSKLKKKWIISHKDWTEIRLFYILHTCTAPQIYIPHLYVRLLLDCEENVWRDPSIFLSVCREIDSQSHRYFPELVVISSTPK